MPDHPTAHLIQEWERARLGVEEYINAMPDEKLPFRPVPEILSFSGQFLHVADANYQFASAAFVCENPFKGKNPEDDPNLQTRETLLAFTLASYDFILTGLNALNDEALDQDVTFFRWKMTRRNILAKALEHHAHHRGQTVIYFRLQGIKPPSERLF